MEEFWRCLEVRKITSYFGVTKAKEKRERKKMEGRRELDSIKNLSKKPFEETFFCRCERERACVRVCVTNGSLAFLGFLTYAIHIFWLLCDGRSDSDFAHFAVCWRRYFTVVRHFSHTTNGTNSQLISPPCTLQKFSPLWKHH